MPNGSPQLQGVFGLMIAAVVACGSEGARNAEADAAGGAAGGGGDDATDAGSAGDGATPAPDAPADPGWPDDRPLLARIDQLCTFILIGPSDAAGFDATGENAPGGRGFMRLVVDNHPSTPAFDEANLSTRYPGVSFVDLAESGARTEQMRVNLALAFGSLDPGAAGCDTWVHFGNPGNDFNDDLATIIDPVQTQAAADTARMNYRTMIDLLTPKFHAPEDGRTMVLSFSTIPDPTDGTGVIPETFTEGFCSVLSNPALGTDVRMAGLANLALMNDEIRAEAAAQNAGVVDQHGAMFGHGTAAADPFISDDCAHPNDAGHHELRRWVWYMLTGEWIGP